MPGYVYRLRRPEITRNLTPARVVARKPRPDYTAMVKADLIAAAEQRGLDTSGTKPELIERLSQ